MVFFLDFFALVFGFLFGSRRFYKLSSLAGTSPLLSCCKVNSLYNNEIVIDVQLL